MLLNDLDEPDLPVLPDWITRLEDHAERQVTRIDGVALHWRIWGDGDPLLLLHGGHGSWRHWVANIDALSAQYRVMAVDLPSFGDSDDYAAEDLQAYAQLVTASAEAVAPARPLRMAGFSFGSVIGTLMLKQATHGVSHFAMLGSPVPGPRNDVSANLRKWRGMPMPDHRAAAHAHNLRVLMLTPDAVTEEAVAIQMAHAELARGDRRGLFAKLDLPAELAAWDGALSVVFGDRDALAEGHLDARREIITGAKPDAAFEVLPGIGHWVQYQAADAVNRLLLDHFAA